MNDTKSQKLKFRKGVFDIAMPNGLRKVKGHIAEGDLIGYHRESSGWLVVDHIPTGLEIDRFPTESLARNFIDEVAKLDWRFKRATAARTEKLRPAILAASNRQWLGDNPWINDRDKSRVYQFHEYLKTRRIAETVQ